MFISKFLGGILLIVGTSIGGGMLALPVATAQLGLGASIVFMILCWFIMMTGALLILEVNLRLPSGSNMVSMAKSTFGLPGQLITWGAYLLLLYALLSAYISGGSNVLSGILQSFHLSAPTWVCSIVFTILIGVVIYQGVRAVDLFNRGLMFGKLGVYLLLVVLIAPQVRSPIVYQGELSSLTGCLMILIASFGFASIVPSLRAYFQDDVPTLLRVIIIGSFIPLVCYVLWNFVIMGVLSENGRHDILVNLAKSDHAISGLTVALSQVVDNEWITGFFSFFTSICMVTAFLAVSLGLFDFLADGLHLKKSGIQGLGVWVLTYLPPLLIVLFYPGIYLNALGYAGICCVFLLLLSPVLMAWKSRKESLPFDDKTWRLPGGGVFLFIMFIVACILLYLAFF